MRSPRTLLSLLHLASAALPIGAFAYSRGLERAVDLGWVTDEASCLSWLDGSMRRSVLTLDVPLMAHMIAAWSDGDEAEVVATSRLLVAYRDTRELRQEERHLGVALARLMEDLGVPEAADWHGAGRLADHATFPALFALACSRWGVPPDDAAAGYAWHQAETSVGAAVKLVPLGQTAGQRILMALSDTIADHIEASLALGPDEVSSSTIAVGLASALHERQYCRLFRS